jgi:hypothetical protein
VIQTISVASAKWFPMSVKKFDTRWSGYMVSHYKTTIMKAAISTLEVSLSNLEANEPINRQEGNVAQADLEAVSAAEIRQALAVMKAAVGGPIYPSPVV